MPLAAQILAGIAALLHVLFFYLESVVFGRPTVYRRFGVADEAAATAVKPMALNQGFYNLFLAIGVIAGIVADATYDAPVAGGGVTSDGATTAFLLAETSTDWGSAVVVFGLACMLGAALVLLVSSRGRLARAAAIQGLAPALALLLIAVA